MRRITQGLVLTALLLGTSGPAAANEFTDVIDAFDTEIGDPWDVNLRVGYERFSKSGLIRRETYDPNQGELHSWDYFAYRDMFEFTQVTHILNLDLDIGIYKDIAIRVRFPLILNDQRELKAHDNMQWSDINGDGVENADDSLFPLPFKSPERSGLDYFAVGLWWGILAQERDDTKPDWTIYAEGRFAVGDVLQASCRSAGDTSCDDRQDQGEDWYKTKGGISRGVNEIAFGTRLSRRYGLFDPYFGFEALLGFPQEGTAYKITNNAAGQINDMPPIVGTLSFGLELVPWEVVEDYRKLSICLGGVGKYHSEGREHTPLFDALGMSPYFNTQDYVDFNGDGEYEGDGSEEDLATREGVWTGMTDVENYATFYGTIFAMIQPAKYVKFKLGFNVGHETEHFITKTDQCPADKMLSDGTCQMYNWGHRPAIDTPGYRFRIEETLIWSFFVDAIAMF